MAKPKMYRVRLELLFTEDQREILLKMATKRSLTMNQLIRNLIEKEWESNETGNNKTR